VSPEPDPESEQAPPPSEARLLRVDARRNRLRILEAAEEVFALQGLGVPIDEVAKRAGVGVGTVYRHFPTKEALFEAVVSARIDGLIRRGEELRASQDPEAAFFAFLAELVALGVDHKDLGDEMARHEQEHPEFKAELKRRLGEALTRLLVDAQDCGAVRRDVEADDLTSLLMGTCMAASHLGSGTDRPLAVVCDGLRVRG
jgi:AcrR family transcriptional regulator